MPSSQPVAQHGVAGGEQEKRASERDEHDVEHGGLPNGCRLCLTGRHKRSIRVGTRAHKRDINGPQRSHGAGDYLANTRPILVAGL